MGTSHWGISMRTSPAERRINKTVGLVVAVVLAALQTVSATTYMSVEPIPNRDIPGVGEANLALLRSIGYDRLAQWSDRLRSECLVVNNVIDTLTAHGAITSITSGNTDFLVAAG